MLVGDLLEKLRKLKKTLSQDSTFSAEIRTGHVPNNLIIPAGEGAEFKKQYIVSYVNILDKCDFLI
jgi:hypothetical protein